MSSPQELLQLTPVFDEVEGGWVQARLLEIPGVITAAPTRDEAEDLLVDALREFLLSFAIVPNDEPAPHSPLVLSLSVTKPSAA